MLYKIFIRPVLFLLDPEAAHNFILKFLSRARFLYPVIRFIFSTDRNKEILIGNLKFRNPLGLAAGFDKNGIAIGLWEAMGFSHVEVGTVTPLPQAGNSKPRIFRLKKDMALINRLGFNNSGADEVRENIIASRKYASDDFLVGVNIGKNRITPIKEAFRDYKICFEKLFDVADYFSINISSPNTEGLRKLHEEQYLDQLLSEIQDLNLKMSNEKNSMPLNIFLKISPDLDSEMIEMVYKLSVRNNISGIIATNTTIERPELNSRVTPEGGLSGKPLKNISDRVISQLNKLNNSRPETERIILIGVGGVFSGSDFSEKINCGASLVQLYTGMIYEGPGIVKKILKHEYEMR